MQNSASPIELIGLTKHFGSVHALRDVDLSIRGGEFLTLLGPSGSGKTTLLNVVQGFEQADIGQVVLGDRDITRLAPSQRGFGMVFQAYSLFPHMSVAQNVGYPLRVRRVKRSSRNERIERALALVDLDELGNRYPSQLSGGQQQRVALARALIYEPPVLLMDEPLTALDRKLRQEMQLYIKRLHKRIDATIIYVTHDQEEALVMSDRLTVMRDGHIIQVGEPIEVYNRPANAFVAGFLGEANLLDTTVISTGPERSLVTIDRTNVEVEAASPWTDQGSVLCVRPEDISIEPLLQQANGLSLTGRVTSVAFTGASARVELESAEGIQLVARTQGQMALGLEDGMSVSIDIGGGVILPQTDEAGSRPGENTAFAFGNQFSRSV